MRVRCRRVREAARAQAAAAEAGSVQRLLLVTAYAISIYSCVDRTWAPFRSPTGETGEILDEEKGIRALGEKARAAAARRRPARARRRLTRGRRGQCAECPGQNAFVCEGRRWVFNADEQNRIEFRGNFCHWRCAPRAHPARAAPAELALPERARRPSARAARAGPPRCCAWRSGTASASSGTRC